MLITDDKEIDIFVGSKIGSFKHVKYHTDPTKNTKKCVENLINIKTLQKDDSITCMVWGDDQQTEVLLGRKNQKIQVYNTQLDSFEEVQTADFGSGDIIGLGRCKSTLLAATSSGVVKIWSEEQEAVVDTGGKLDRMRTCGDDATLFGTGGEENDLKVWRVGEKTPVFTAKNLPHDWLQLRRPVWVSDLVFMPGDAGNTVAVCSRHGYVRLYDIRAQRRPVCNVEFKMAATCIAPSFHEKQVLVGFGRGQLHQVDLRRARPDKGYKGSVGAVTDIALIRDGGLVATTSLDRHLRVHRHQTKELVYKQYMTSKLTCLLVQSENSTPLRRVAEQEVKEEIKVEIEEIEEDGHGDDLDELFEHMETIGEKPRKKKREKEDTRHNIKKIRPSSEGSTDVGLDDTTNTDDAIVRLLKSTEKQKRRLEKRKREKKAKSVFYNA